MSDFFSERGVCYLGAAAIIRKERTNAMATPTQTYVIVDPLVKPDLRGEFHGAKVEKRGDKLLVRMTDAQARFALDQGAIKLESFVKSAEESAKPDQKTPPKPPAKV